MSADRQLEQQLSMWFPGQTTSASPELLRRAVAQVERMEQRPAFLTRDWWVGRAPLPGGRVLVPAVVVLMLLIAAALVVTSGGLVQPRPPVVADTKAFFAPPTEVAFRAVLHSAGSIPQFNWRSGTYSTYSGTGWSWGDVVRIPVAAGERIHAFSASDEPATTGRIRVDIAVTPVTFDGSQVVGPDSIESVDVPVEAVAVGVGHWFTSIERRDGSGPYALSALLPVPSAASGRLNEATLRGAGQEYSASMLGVYTDLPEDAVGPASMALLDEIRAAVPSGHDPRNPYDLARTMERYLLEPAHFAYDADVRAEVAEQCDGLSTVECFATIRRGYCEYYATTMAVLLRESGIPARIGYGFLAGKRGTDGVETVGGSLAHWWVEVYFPGVGWYPFDPTGSVGRPFTLPPGT